MKKPSKTAFLLAKKMKEFRAKTELPTTNREEMNEVVRQMDWNKFDEVVNYLEFTHKNK